MDVEKFTSTSNDAIMQAITIAKTNRQTNVDTPHLLMAMLEDKFSQITFFFTESGINKDEVKRQVNQLISTLPKGNTETQQVYITSELNNILNEAQTISNNELSTYFIKIIGTTKT